jgi:hypothetical protein
MANYANQIRIITGHHSDIRHVEGTKEQWLQPTKWEPLKEAMRLLKGNAFKLYMYLLSWDGAKIYDFSPAGIAKELKMSDEGARNAKQELIDKGYLITNENGQLEFFPISRTNVSCQKI